MKKKTQIPKESKVSLGTIVMAAQYGMQAEFEPAKVFVAGFLVNLIARIDNIRIQNELTERLLAVDSKEKHIEKALDKFTNFVNNAIQQPTKQ